MSRLCFSLFSLFPPKSAPIRHATHRYLVLAMLLMSGPSTAAVGLSEFTIAAPQHKGAPLATAVFYPVDEGNTAAAATFESERFAENAVFHGVDVIRDAGARDGRYPVVLLSHGLGGLYRSMAWLATALAERGAIVVAVNHPNSSFGSFDMRRGLDHGTRAADMKQVLDALSVSADGTDSEVDKAARAAFARWRPLIDPERVHAVGFSYGGWTVLSLAGIRGNLDGYRASCQASGDASSHCADIARHGVDLGDLSSRSWNADYADARIRSVVAIDPGLIHGLEQAQLAHLHADITLVALGGPEHRLFATDIGASGSGFASMLVEHALSQPRAGQSTQVNIAVLDGASHFSALPVCTPEGREILIREKDDPVCDVPPGGDRARTHRQIIEIVIRDLGLDQAADAR